MEKASSTPAVKRRGLFCFDGSLTFLVTTKARLFNAALIYAIVCFILFQHNFYVEWVHAIGPDSDDPGPDDGTDPMWLAKAVVPTFEAAAMFIVLFGMALLPITLCRWLVAQVAKTGAARYLPLTHLVDFHIFVGTSFVVQLLVILLLFIVFFAVNCWRYNHGLESADYCRGTTGQVQEDGTFYTSEIMATGYGIVALTLMVTLPAFKCIRKRIPYEWFYGLHHAFIPLYALCIAHTFDTKTREMGFDSRVQVIIWVSAPIILYTIDRTMRNASIRSMRVVSTKLLAFPSRTLFLRLARPAGWNFLVGQYVRVCVPAISEAEYHPFTIASSTSSGEVELIIRVVESEGKGQVLRGKKNVDGTIVGGAATAAATAGHGATATASNPDAAATAGHAQGKYGTWTERVYNYFADLSRTPDIAVHVRIEGPYGSVMQGAFSLPNVVLLASGTGIVPMLSALREFYASDKFSLRVRANEVDDALLRDSDSASAPVSASASAFGPGPSPASAFAPASAARAPIVGMGTGAANGRSASPLALMSMEPSPRSASPSTATGGAAAGVRAVNVMVRPSSASGSGSSSSSSAAPAVSGATDAAASAPSMRIDSVNVRRPSLVAPGPAEDASAGAVGLLTSPQPQRGPTPPPVIVPSAMPAPAAAAVPASPAPILRAGRSSRSGSPAAGGSRSASPAGSRRGSDAAVHLMSVTLETSFTPGVEIDVERRRRAAQREWAAERAAAAAAAVLNGGSGAGGSSSRPTSASALAKAANRSVMSQRLLIARTVQFTGPPDLRGAAGVPSIANAGASASGSLSSIAEAPDHGAAPAGSPNGASAVSLAEGGRATVDTLRALMDRRRESALFWRAATRFPIVFGCSIMLGAFQFMALWLELSWRNAGVGREPELDGMPTAYTWPYMALDIMTAIAIAGFMALALAQPLLLSERSSSSLTTALLRNAQSGPLILHLLAASAQAILLAASFGEPRMYGGLIFAVFEILRAYQMCFHYATNPLFLVAGPENAAAMRRGAAFLTGANLVWVNRDASAFLCLAEEMAAIADDIAATCGDDFMQVRVYITGAVTPAERAAIAGIVEGSPLEGAVTFGRPDMPALLNGMCAQLAAPVPPVVGGVKEASADCGCFGGSGGAAGGSASSPRFVASPAVSPPLAHTTSAFGPEGAGGAALLPRDPALNVLFCGTPGLAASVRESVMAARDTYKGRLVVAFSAETVFG